MDILQLIIFPTKKYIKIIFNFSKYIFTLFLLHFNQ